MTARFSSESFDHPQCPAYGGEPGPAETVAAPLPSAACEVLTRDLLASAACADSEAVDVDEVFVPEHYEPNYAYPLIAWLSLPGRSNGRPQRLHRLMRMVSERNYFAISVPVTDPDRIEEQLYASFIRLRRRYHLHTERVYLLGFGDAGTQALETGLRQPDWFAGVAAISARWPDSLRLLARFDELRGKRVLLGIEESDNAPLVADCLYMQQLLWSAGMHVTALASSDGANGGRSLLREVDRWVMQAIEQPELVC